MNEMQFFQELKTRVLERYREHYPYFQGSWKTFSSQDILNLIALLESECKETVSEKWIYTHLKPEANEKLPRKNMLNVLCRFVGVSSWDEFSYVHPLLSNEPAEIPQTVVQSKRNPRIWIGLVVLVAVVLVVVNRAFTEKQKAPVRLQNQYTQEPVDSSEVQVYDIADTVFKQPISPQELQNKRTNQPIQVRVKSPFYKDTVVQLPPIAASPKAAIVQLQPDDYAMMVKAFLKADIQDWQKRKQQLQKILSEDLEVLVMLKGGLGTEYYNKSEFVRKLTIPTPVLKRWEIIELEKETDGTIRLLRIKQE
ncbi:MAG: hypothetical protein RLZZ500_2421 [Bacteroidota bacterium]|jgi:hypothetical protein